MEWIYLLGIIILFCKVVNSSQIDCTVNTDYREQHWSGDEVKFYAYVLKKDAVNIKITYKLLDITDFFTTFYFSPSTNYSKRIETVKGKDLHFKLTTMEMANDWFEFKISSEKETIEYACQPNIHEIIPINQTSHTFNELIIRASNISLCENERDWEILEENYITIPLGRDSNIKSFLLKFYPRQNVKPVIRIFNSRRKLSPSIEYQMLITKTRVTLRALQGTEEDIIIDVDQLITSIDMISEFGRFTTTLIFGANTQFFQNVIQEADCPTCIDTICIGTLVLIIVVSCIVGLAIKFNICKSRIGLTKILYKNKESYHHDMGIKVTYRNNGTSLQRLSLSTGSSEENSV